MGVLVLISQNIMKPRILHYYIHFVLDSFPYSAASCFEELQAIITAISEIPALPAKPRNAQLFSGNLRAR